jgi:hypothetical protein
MYPRVFNALNCAEASFRGHRNFRFGSLASANVSFLFSEDRSLCRSNEAHGHRFRRFPLDSDPPLRRVLSSIIPRVCTEESQRVPNKKLDQVGDEVSRRDKRSATYKRERASSGWEKKTSAGGTDSNAFSRGDDGGIGRSDRVDAASRETRGTPRDAPNAFSSLRVNGGGSPFPVTDSPILCTADARFERQRVWAGGGRSSRSFRADERVE